MKTIVCLEFLSVCSKSVNPDYIHLICDSRVTLFNKVYVKELSTFPFYDILRKVLRFTTGTLSQTRSVSSNKEFWIIVGITSKKYWKSLKTENVSV